MTKEQAIQTIKEALDRAVKAGVFTGLQEVSILTMAYSVISQELTKKEG